MKRFSARFFTVLILISLTFNLFPKNSLADEFAQAQIRLDRHKISTTSGGQVCATTPSSDNGGETNVQVIFPTGFTVNATASNWTVTTTNLPTGATAWPGVGTATAVSGQIVTFPSSNLSTSTNYCFNFSGTSTLTTPSATGNYEGTLRTRVTSTVIDSLNFGFSIVNNDQITVTATVPADPTDFEADLEITNHNNNKFRQGETLIYTLTYGSNLSTPSNITPEIEWDLGTISGAGTPTVEVLEYDINSATNAHGATAPVVDLVNRKISWPISSFPANTTGQKVTFQLRTTSEYTGPLNVDFAVKGRVLGPGTQSADSTVNASYKHNYSDASTPQQPGDGMSDGTTDGSASSPQPPLGAFAVTKVDVREISPEKTTIFAATNKLSDLTLSYGTNQFNLNRKISSNTQSIDHILNLENLVENTRYFFRINAKSSSENTTSDIFTFITAASSGQITYNPESLTVLAENIVLFDSTHTNLVRNDLPNVPIPIDTNFSIKLKLENYSQLKNVSIFARNKNVLGISNVTSIKNYSNSNAVLELSTGEFVSSLSTDKTTGEYELITKIEDFSGNITELTIAIVKVIDSSQVFEKGGKTPIENAKINFYVFNLRLKTFTLISPTILSIKNPSYTDSDGHVHIALPEGQYRAEIVALGFEPKTVEFEIGIGKNHKYPTVKLLKNPFSLVTAFKYYNSIFNDLLTSSNKNIEDLKNSNRFFDFISLVSLSFSTILLILAILHKFGIPLLMLPWLTIFAFQKIAGNHEHIIQGLVTDDETQTGISGANVYISLPSGKIVSHTTTSQSGEFFAKSPSKTVKITVSHKNYRNFLNSYTPGQTDKRISILLVRIKKGHILTLNGLLWYSRYIFASLFESFIFTTLILEIILISNFGIFKMLPFIFVTAISLLLWASMHKKGLGVRE